MSVIRVNKNKNYTVMSNKHLKDKNLSLKAKGLLSIMLSLPENWDYSITGLINICKEGERAVKTTLEELKRNNYLIITKKYPNETESGRIEYIYDIYEEPIVKKQEVRFVGVENVALQNAVQLNTKNKITKNKEKYNKKKFQNFEQRKYSEEELNKLIENIGEEHKEE